MKTATIRELSSRGGKIFDGSESVLIKRRGKVVGILQPLPRPSKLPLEIRRKRYAKTSAKLARQLDAKGITEEKLQRDFEALRKNRRRH
jgi:hypothetical protein